MNPERLIKETLSKIEKTQSSVASKALEEVEIKTKPPGSLGLLEDTAVKAAAIQNTLKPKAEARRMFVFAGDHGVTEEGVSAFPSEVTKQMVANFCCGGAAINVFCRQHNIKMRVIDSGVDGELPDHPLLLKRKTGNGTKNFFKNRAMTEDEALHAVASGIETLILDERSDPFDITGFGEMGIGNTTAASAIIAAALGITGKEASGRGTGIDANGLNRKAEVIDRALKIHTPDPENGLDILSKVGGFEIAGIAGGILAAASLKKIIVLDGLISTSGAIIASLINPDVKDYLVSGHMSVEPGHRKALDFLGLSPLIDLKFRLGEGTGAALAISIVDSACRMLSEMSTFKSAGVSNNEE